MGDPTAPIIYERTFVIYLDTGDGYYHLYERGEPVGDDQGYPTMELALDAADEISWLDWIFQVVSA